MFDGMTVNWRVVRVSGSCVLPRRVTKTKLSFDLISLADVYVEEGKGL